VREHSLEFAEREVVIARSTPEQLGRVVAHTDSVAEIRLARDTPSFFMGMHGAEQRAWSADLAGRLVLAPTTPGGLPTRSGTTMGHALIAPYLNAADQQAFDTGWSVEDYSNQVHGGHGTQMSGTALYGDLMEVLDGNGPVEVRHRLDRSRSCPTTVLTILISTAPSPPNRSRRPRSSLPTARVPSASPLRALAIIGADASSSWSAKLDAITFGRDEVQRFMAVAAGNVEARSSQRTIPPATTPCRSKTRPKPGDVLTVGAFTERTVITDPAFAGWSALGLAGDIMPRSRTSVSWHREWPLKPDVVFEGGNIGHDPATGNGDHVDDLALLTTYRITAERPFTTTGDTSAATALAARMGAQILAEKPALWPETVRGLIVHSAEWTPAMRANQGAIGKPALLRRYGFGVPSLARALGSLDHDVTIVAEEMLVPFKMKSGKAVTDELAVHALPWPRETLLALGEAQVLLRISYFIEPNPGERGLSRRHLCQPRPSLRPQTCRRTARRVLASTHLGSRSTAAGAHRAGHRLDRRSPAAQPRLASCRYLGRHGDRTRRPRCDHRLSDRGWWRENVAQGHVGEAVRYSLIASMGPLQGGAIC
jgi:hypothetical protein